MDDRTIANELQNGSTQSSLACIICRRKKLKCDRSIPGCRNCQKASRSCEYPEVAHKPGPRPGTHRRAHGTNRTNVSKTRSITSKRSPPGTTANLSHSRAASDASSVYHYGSDSVNGIGPQHTAKVYQSPPLKHLSTSDSPFSTACKMIGIPEQSCLNMVEIYFANMTAFSLFHQPTFMAKVASIDSAKQLQALFLSMFAFSLRFLSSGDLVLDNDMQPHSVLENAYVVGHECLRECSDETPPLHLLQSFILQTLFFSTIGVRGKCWRLAGQCIRIAYELRLHELDSDTHDGHPSSDVHQATSSEQWVALEEKRRTWWAIWECDVFTSTIQRLPNGIDWTRNRTNLPSCDQDWFDGKPTRSCHLQVDPNNRWRYLRDSGNTSPVAWFIVLNSYKWDSLSLTQRISPPTTFFDQADPLKDKFDTNDYRPVLARKRETLENCLRCALAAIPDSLQPNGFLTFEQSRGRYPSLTRIRDNGIYMIHTMSQVTQLLLFRKDLEGGNYIAYPADFTQATTDSGQQAFTVPPQGHAERKRWQRCLLVADQMADMVRNSAPDHHKFVSPNLATALWMAAATQLAVLAYHPAEIDVELARSNLDLLTTTIESFVRFWDVPRTLLQSLSTLQQQLKALGNKQVEGSRPVQGSPADPGDGTNTGVGSVEPAQLMGDIPDLSDGESTLDLSPFDVLQAMDFGAMYNGVENWENLFLDPGFPSVDFAY